MNDSIIIITEGQFDAKLLQKVLPSKIVAKSRFVSSGGFSSALSKAKSIAIRLTQPIFLILDSDTMEHNETAEKKEQIEYIFKSLGKLAQVKVFLFEPKIEVIFFESTKLQKKLGKMLPQTHSLYFRQLLNNLSDKNQFLDKLDQTDIESLQTETSLKKLIRLF